MPDHYSCPILGAHDRPENEMPHMPLTDIKIRSVKPKEKTFKLFDSVVASIWSLARLEASIGVGNTALLARKRGLHSGSIRM